MNACWLGGVVPGFAAAWKPAPECRAVAVGFDGVIHSYTTPWINPHTIPGPPVKGSLEWLFHTSAHYDIVIHSRRARTCRGRCAIRRWLAEHMPAHHWAVVQHGLRITHRKPRAHLYIDDKAWRFDGPGTLPTRGQIEGFRHWSRRPPVKCGAFYATLEEKRSPGFDYVGGGDSECVLDAGHDGDHPRRDGLMFALTATGAVPAQKG